MILWCSEELCWTPEIWMYCQNDAVINCKLHQLHAQMNADLYQIPLTTSTSLSVKPAVKGRDRIWLIEIATADFSKQCCQLVEDFVRPPMNDPTTSINSLTKINEWLRNSDDMKSIRSVLVSHVCLLGLIH